MTATPENDSTASTSTSLLLRIRDNEKGAWEKFVRLYTPLIYSWCRQNGLQPGDTDDACQDALASVFRGIGGYEHTGSFRAWLWQVVRRRVQDHYRRKARHPQADGGSTFLQRMASIPEAPPDDASADALLLRALTLMEGQFERTTWRAFWLMVVEHQTALETAQQLGWCADGEQRGAARVRQAKARVIRCVREEYGDLIDELAARNDRRAERKS